VKRKNRDGLGFTVRVFAAVWAGWALLGLLGVQIITAGHPVSVPGLDAQPASPGWHNLLTVGNRGDALWYQRIAAGGYRTDDATLTTSTKDEAKRSVRPAATDSPRRA
jgi:hypothetical protein